MKTLKYFSVNKYLILILIAKLFLVFGLSELILLKLMNYQSSEEIHGIIYMLLKVMLSQGHINSMSIKMV